MLDYFGVDMIEISPVISPSHERSCKALINEGLRAEIIAHCRALKSDIDVALRCDAKWIALYLSVSDIHLKYKLRITREDVLDRAVSAVDYAKDHGLHLRFTMEDATRADPAFLRRMCLAVVEAKADRICIPDTLGLLRPGAMYNLIRTVRRVVDIPLDVHCHNDLGLALANSLAGLEAGADQIHVSINGLGERVGIPSLAEAVMLLTLLYGVELKVKTEVLKELSDLIEEYTGVPTPDSKPLVGRNAYRHKAGTHVTAIIRNPACYEIIPPKTVGNTRRLIFGGLSGKNGVAFLLRVLGIRPTEEEAHKIAQGLKRLKCGDLFELNFSEELEEFLVNGDVDC